VVVKDKKEPLTRRLQLFLVLEILYIPTTLTFPWLFQ
jgi:hypothetical protein